MRQYLEKVSSNFPHAAAQPWTESVLETLQFDSTLCTTIRHLG